jgi:uncharacterized RDD family membrane protein YckC
MYCGRCGAAVPEGGAFCTACGQAMNPAGAPGYGPLHALPAQPILPYAGFWLRFVAYLIDSAVGTGALLVLGGIAAAILAGLGLLHRIVEGMRTDNPVFEGVFFAVFFGAIAVLFVANWIYFAWMESSSCHGTLGKMAMGLAVSDLDGRPIRFGRASGRYFAKIITGMIPFAIGYILAGFTEKKQALHDMIASTLVLHKS